MAAESRAARSERRAEPPSLAPAGIVLGLGLGGFVDGIVLHQIFQWHNMLSSTERWPTTTLRNLEINVIADGLFHAATWVAVVAGLALLWRAARGSATRFTPRALIGWMLAGWGIFNVVEGLIDHHILGIHHVRPGESQLAWDIGFLAFGGALILGGWLVARIGERSLESSPRPNGS